jgi:hypothetical protein
MSRCWLALLDGPHDAATAQASAGDAGWLVAWRSRTKPVREARRIDCRLIDPGGGPACVSLVLPPRGVRLPFDDVAVQQARRAVLAGPPAVAVSTLLRDDRHFEGAITVARDPARLRDDPFARIFPALLLDVGAGLLGSVGAPAGPVIERYGSAQPWPADRFV